MFPSAPAVSSSICALRGAKGIACARTLGAGAANRLARSRLGLEKVAYPSSACAHANARSSKSTATHASSLSGARCG